LGEYLISGFLLGLAAGVAPGPLLLLAVSETISGKIKNGIYVSIAPLITDLPIVVIALLILSQASENDVVFGAIHLAGALYLTYLALSEFMRRKQPLAVTRDQSNSLVKGAVINFLNPHPYIFWLSIGGAMVTKGWQLNPSYAIGFIALFYLLLVGSKIIIVFAVGKVKSLLNTRGYWITIKILSVLMLAIAFLLVKDGLDLIGLF